ncbi:fatty acyl-AMP ligase [Agromyces sp. Soil535]|uniref:fatty acyl-AMP ligase n=1 Tax=Agromyces sp. Soil535 TaxID=1736390 RepID=UPI0006FC263E|nr:fatty acyl-AMP ligase [Agromyces sp. Soil535]KRE25943.1 hypothetical protein ASG80_03675 [Agromyces sp. Soil535]
MNPKGTFLDVMRNAAATAGDARGFRFYASPSDSVFASYEALDRQARADAAALVASGHAAGDVAVLAFDPGLGFIRALYAVFYAGLVAAPVPVAAIRQPDAALRRLASIVADSGSRIVLTEGGALLPLCVAPDDSVGEARVVSIDSLVGRIEEWVPPASDAGSLALLQYTSGSTGTPKGVMVSHGNLVANEAAITSALGLSAASRLVGWLPHYHDMGLVGQLLQPIFFAGDCVFTSPNQFLRRPLLWLKLITQHRATHTVGPDFAYALCTRLVTDEQLAGLDLSSLEGAITGAEPVRVETLRAFAERFARAGFQADAFIPAYGMAETTLLVTAKAAGRVVATIQADAAGIEQGVLRAPVDGGRAVDLVSCGPAADGHRIEIVDPVSGERLVDGEIGEILVSGPSVAQGYWRRPDATAAVFGVTIPGDGDDHRYLRTGDLGTSVAGELLITGRLKDLIIIRGRNIYPQDLEQTASTLLHAGCLSAAFEGSASQPAVGLVAEIDAARLAAGEIDALAERVRRAVTEEYLLPELGVALIRKGSLPRTTSGKVQRNLTRSLLAEERLPTLLMLGFDRGAVT